MKELEHDDDQRLVAHPLVDALVISTRHTDDGFWWEATEEERMMVCGMLDDAVMGKSFLCLRLLLRLARLCGLDQATIRDRCTRFGTHKKT